MEVKEEKEAKQYQKEFDTARKYIRMGDKIRLSRFKVKFYQDALDALKNVPSIPEADAIRADASRSINDANAGIVIEAFDFAQKSKEFAETSEDMGSAGGHYREVELIRENLEIDVESLSDGIRLRYEETGKAAELAEHCEKKAQVTFQVQRIRVIAGMLFAVLLAGMIAYGFKTSTVHILVGKVESAIGMHSSAVSNFEQAYKRHKSEKTEKLLSEASYKLGVAQYKKGQLEDAILNLHTPAMDDYMDADSIVTAAEFRLMEEAQVGDLVYYGSVKWRVLDKEGSILTLLKNDAADGRAFQDDPDLGYTWETSSLRAYLNGEYMDRLFGEMEKACILQTAVPADDNTKYNISAGNSTIDQVYILSITEFQKYKEQINKCSHNYWLRTPGSVEGSMAFVDVEQLIMDFGCDTGSEAMYIKPVIRVDYSAVQD